MKAIFVIASLLLLQSVWNLPAIEEDETPECASVFSAEVCDEFDEIDANMMEDEDRVRRQLSPPPGGGGPDGGNGGTDAHKKFLEELLLKKLQFLINLGILRNIPILGQAIHDLVERDPEGVAKALSGGIFGLIQLGLKLLAGGGIGR